MFSTLFGLLFMAGLCYAAYRIVRYAWPQMRTQAVLNRFVAKESPVQNGGTQPVHDYNHAMSSDRRLHEVNQLERVFENGYKVNVDGEWRG